MDKTEGKKEYRKMLLFQHSTSVTLTGSNESAPHFLKK